MQWSENRLLQYIQNIVIPYHPFFGKKYAEMGIRGRDLRGAADIRRLPLVTKRDYADDHLAFVLQPRFPGREPLYHTAPIRKTSLLKYAWQARGVPRVAAMQGNGDSLRDRTAAAARREWFPMHFHASGGTTGNPSPALYTWHDIFVCTPRLATMANWCGISLEHKCLNLFPAAPHLAFFQVVFSQMLLGGSVFHTCGGSVMPTERQVQLAERAGFDYVVGIPSYLTYWLDTAIRMRERGEIKKLHAIKFAVVAAEPMTPAYRDRLRGQFEAVGCPGVKIIEGYGMTELKGAFYECAEGGGIHLSPENFYWEVLDPDTHEPVPYAQPGVLTFSHIGYRGTVFIRYFTGDLIKGLLWDTCPHCGRTGPRLLTPMCRAVKDFTKIKGSRVNLLDLQTAIRGTPGVEAFHVIITKENPGDPFSRDWVRVHVAPRGDADRNTLDQTLRKNVKLTCEISPSEVVFTSPDDIERRLFARTGLKADWIVDERQVHV